MPDILVESTHCSWLLDDIGIPIGIQTPQGVKQYFTKSPAKNTVLDPTNVAITGGTISGATVNITSGTITNTNNLAATQLYKFRSALARQATGGAFAKVALIGDSTTAGAISDAVTANWRPNSWSNKLASLLTTAGVPATMSNALGNAQGANGNSLPFNQWDARLSATGSFINSTSLNMAGGLSPSGQSAGTLSFTPGVTTDTVDFYYFDAGGSFSINVDGGATIQTVTLTNTFLPKKVTVSYALGLHIINVVWVSGSFNVVGFDAYNSTAPQVHLLNLGCGGAQAGLLAANVNAYDPIPWYKFIAPDLSIISLGINDWINVVPVATYSANLQIIINTALLSGDVILMTPFPSDVGQATLANQVLYVAAMRNLASTNGLLLIDENYNLVSKSVMGSRGLGFDVNHPNGIGHSVIARDIKNVLTQFV